MRVPASSLTKSGCIAVSQRGFILIPVLWVLALLALVCAILTRSVSTDIKSAGNMLYQTDAELLSDGIARLAVRYVVAKGLEANHAGAFNLNGEPLVCAVGDSTAVISVVQTTGLIDINEASLDVLEKFYASLGATAPASLAAATVDFRDGDDVVSPQGAERAEYAAADLPYGPKNSRFDEVAEIEQVLGVTPDLVQRALPLLTTRSHLPTPDPDVGIPQITSMGFSNDQAFGGLTPKLRIQVSVGHRNRPHVTTRQADVLIQSRIKGGYILKDWSRPNLSVTAPTPDGLPSCVASVLSLAE